MKDYYPIFVGLFLVLILGIAGHCTRQEGPLPELTREQKAEIMSRQSDFDRAQNIDLADRILAARVERSWREGDK